MSQVVPSAVTVTASSNSEARSGAARSIPQEWTRYKHNKRAPALRHRLVGTVMAGALIIGGVSAAHAALTTPSCLAKKLKEWGKLRKCQATENAKALQANRRTWRSARSSSTQSWRC